MSVEIRLNEQDDLECVWGMFDNGEADPNRDLKHLMLVTGDYIKDLLENGPQPGPRGGYHSASTDGDRLFAHLDYDGRTTWELFKAHWWDGGEPNDVMIGRWPD
jgi:hypothetical protein